MPPEAATARGYNRTCALWIGSAGITDLIARLGRLLPTAHSEVYTLLVAVKPAGDLSHAQPSSP
jgi:hypothetical protein